MAKALARSIKTRRDYRGATSVVKKVREQSARVPDAERRLQALLQEIEKFDDPDLVEDNLDQTEDVEDFPRRRWSDDSYENE